MGLMGGRRIKRRRTGPRAARFLAALLLAAWLQAALLTAASAHAELVRSDPADNAALVTAPQTVHLWFSEAIAPGFTGARVITSHGVTVPGVRAHADPSDNTLLVLNLPSLPDGVYVVAYTALSAADGHTTQGHIAFQVGSGPGLAAASAGPAVAWPDVVLHWLDFLAQAGLVGSLAVAFVLLNRDDGASTTDALRQGQRRVLLWGALCALLALLVGAAAFYRQAAQLAESMPGNSLVPLGPLARQLVVTTVTGQLWLGRQVILVVMAADLACLWVMRPATRRRALPGLGVILGLLAAGLIATTALSGHAAALEPRTTLAVLVDWAHLVAASLWVGGLLALVVGVLPVLLRRRGTPGYGAFAHAAWGPFGIMAALSVATLFATGLYNTGRQVASPDALLTSLYGRALMVKIAVVLLVGLVGLGNSMLLHPQVAAPLGRALRKPAGWRPLPITRLPAHVIAEVSLGVAVLFLTGIMTSTTPPHGQAFAPQAAQAGPKTLTTTVDDLSVALSAEPNLPGANTISVQVKPDGESSQASERSPEILRVILHLTYLQQSLGEVTADAAQVSPGLYRLSGSQLSLAGPWQIQVAVRRKGVEDSVARFNWTVPQAAPSQKVVVSDRPWGVPLTIAAVVLAFIVLAIVLGMLVAARIRPGDANASRTKI